MSTRKPQVRIVNNGDFTTAAVGKKLVAVKVRFGETWYVVTADQEPQRFTSEWDATKVFLAAAGVIGGAK